MGIIGSVLLYPFLKVAGNMLADGRVFFLALPLHIHGFSESIPPGHARAHWAQFLDLATLPPGVRLQREGNHGHPGLARQFDANGIEVALIKSQRPRTLRKNNNGYSFFQALKTAFKHCRQIFARIGAPDNNGVA